MRTCKNHYHAGFFLRLRKSLLELTAKGLKSIADHSFLFGQGISQAAKKHVLQFGATQKIAHLEAERVPETIIAIPLPLTKHVVVFGERAHEEISGKVDRISNPPNNSKEPGEVVRPGDLLIKYLVNNVPTVLLLRLIIQKTGVTKANPSGCDDPEQSGSVRVVPEATRYVLDRLVKNVVFAGGDIRKHSRILANRVIACTVIGLC